MTWSAVRALPRRSAAVRTKTAPWSAVLSHGPCPAPYLGLGEAPTVNWLYDRAKPSPKWGCRLSGHRPSGPSDCERGLVVGSGHVWTARGGLPELPVQPCGRGMTLPKAPGTVGSALGRLHW